MATGIRQDVTLFLERLAASDLSGEETEEALAELRGYGEWPEVRDALLLTLMGDRIDLWPEAVRLIYLLQGRGSLFEADRTIALLYDCLTLDDNLDGNLVWTITKDLKGKTYLSEYDPYKDDGVVREMEGIQRRRGRT